jgi:hypothetical protein
VLDPTGDLPATAESLAPVLEALAGGGSSARGAGTGAGVAFAHRGAPPPLPGPLLAAAWDPGSDCEALLLGRAGITAFDVSYEARGRTFIFKKLNRNFLKIT